MTDPENDRLFKWVILVLGGFMLVFGVGSLILVAINHPSDAIAFRLIGAIGAMFTGVIGLVIGYMTGRK